MSYHILQISNSALQFPSVDRLCSLAGVLEADTKIGAAGACALRAGDRLGCVADLKVRISVSITVL